MRSGAACRTAEVVIGILSRSAARNLLLMLASRRIVSRYIYISGVRDMSARSRMCAPPWPRDYAANRRKAQATATSRHNRRLQPQALAARSPPSFQFHSLALCEDPQGFPLQSRYLQLPLRPPRRGKYGPTFYEIQARLASGYWGDFLRRMAWPVMMLLRAS